MLSRLLRFRIVDEAGRYARLVDVATDVSGNAGAGPQEPGADSRGVDYPPVTLAVYDHAGQRRVLEWSSLRPDWRRGRLTVRDIDEGRPVSDEALDRMVLLRRDLLDAMLLDLANRHAVRANDLWLEDRGEGLALRGADISPRGVVRRLTGGRLGAGSPRNLLDWKDVEFLRGDPDEARAGLGYHRRIVRLLPADIAKLIDALPYLHAVELLLLLPEPVAADTLEAMTPERQLQVFEELQADHAGRLLALMAPDVAADLVGHLTPDIAGRFLERLPPEPRERVLELLKYPEDSAGGIMTNDVVLVERGTTVGEARRALVDALREPDFVYYVYVVDSVQARHLCGVVTLRDLLVADESARLSDAMHPHPVAIDPFMPAQSAAEHVAENNLAALPVVADDGRLLGAITADVAVAQILPTRLSSQTPRIFS